MQVASKMLEWATRKLVPSASMRAMTPDEVADALVGSTQFSWEPRRGQAVRSQTELRAEGGYCGPGLGEMEERIHAEIEIRRLGSSVQGG
jgi:hypothetical protein